MQVDENAICQKKSSIGGREIKITIDMRETMQKYRRSKMFRMWHLPRAGVNPTACR